VLPTGIPTTPVTQFARLRSLATYNGAAELDEGLTIVIAVLRSQLLD